MDSRVCRCYSYQGATGGRGAGHRAQHLDYDSKLGHALTLVQLGKWQEAAEMFKGLNEFYKEQCVPESHITGTDMVVPLVH
jgi:hypothetical protein